MVLHPLGIFILVFLILVRKIPFAGIELTSQRVRRLRGSMLSEFRFYSQHVFLQHRSLSLIRK